MFSVHIFKAATVSWIDSFMMYLHDNLTAFQHEIILSVPDQFNQLIKLHLKTPLSISVTCFHRRYCSITSDLILFFTGEPVRWYLYCVMWHWRFFQLLTYMLHTSRCLHHCIKNEVTYIYVWYWYIINYVISIYMNYE